MEHWRKNLIGILCLLLVLLTGCTSSKETDSVNHNTETEENSFADIYAETEKSGVVEEGTETKNTNAQPQQPDADEAPLEEGITIQENGVQLANEMANQIYTDLLTLVVDPQEDIYKYENFRMTVYDEQTTDTGVIQEQIRVMYDCTLVRDPKQDPYVVGMTEAKESLEDETKIEYADEAIEEVLAPLESEYQTTKKLGIEVVVSFEPGAKEYALYYKDGSKDKLILLEEYSRENFSEDAAARRKAGKEYLIAEVNYLTEKNKVPLDEGITIAKKCRQIKNKMANEVFQELKKQLKAAYKGRANLEDFSMEVKEEKEAGGGIVQEKIVLKCRWMSTRKAEEDPFILGMMEIRDALTDKDEIQTANEAIDGWLAELNGYRTSEEAHSYTMTVSIAFRPGSQEYELYSDYGKLDELVLLEEYIQDHIVEDVEQRKQDGRIWMLEHGI